MAGVTKNKKMTAFEADPAQIARVDIVRRALGETRSAFIRASLELRLTVVDVQVVKPADADPDAEPVVFVSVQ